MISILLALASALPPTTVVLVAASDRGAGPDIPLSFAERDAERIADALEDSVEGAEIHRHIGVDADGLQSALAELSQRITTLSAKGAKVTAIVYYSVTSGAWGAAG